jgi:hypothetical protein
MSWLSRWLRTGGKDVIAGVLAGTIRPQEALQAAAAGTLQVGLSHSTRREKAVQYLGLSEALLVSLGRQDLSAKVAEVGRLLDIGGS